MITADFIGKEACTEGEAQAIIILAEDLCIVEKTPEDVAIVRGGR